MKDIMIPIKRNKMGWRYAFACFHGVQLKHELERSIDNIWIGSYKLRANLSKYMDQVSRLGAKIQNEGRVWRPALRKENTSFCGCIKGGQTSAET